jgi:hypothetical protein
MFATAPIAMGEKLIQYKGRPAQPRRSRPRLRRRRGQRHTFLFTLNDEYVIDANLDCNAARWINHSCNRTARRSFYEDEGGNKRKDQVWIESRRAINAGRGAELQLRHHAGRAPHAEAEEAVGLPCGANALHRHHAAAQAPKAKKVTA